MRKKLLLTFFILPLILSLLSATMIGSITALVTHDIAVVSVIPSSTSVRLGELINVTVVVENQGTENETFNVTAYFGTTAIQTKTNITLAATANTSLTFAWNTTNVEDEVYAMESREETYAIKATASIVPGETDIEDNTRVSPSTVRVVSQYIAVLPQSTVDPTLDIDSTYTVSIYTDYDGTDVWGWEFTLTYNPSVLHGISVTNGDLITKTKDDSATFISGEFDNVNGELSLTSASFQYAGTPLPVTSGPGTLANVTFEVISIGDSDIELGTETVAPSRLIGYNATEGKQYNIIDDWNPDLYHILHGYFKNTLEEVIHDIAVISVTPSNTSVIAGDLVDVNAVVKNNGTATETEIKVKVYYDLIVGTYLIGTQTISTLGAGTSKSLAFSWDTTDTAKGVHRVIAVASTVPGEKNEENNVLESDTQVAVTVTEAPPLPIELIIVVVAVIVVVIAAVTYATKLRKKPTSE